MRRSPIPYGVVMATGASAMLAAKGGLTLLAEPLLMLAVAEAAGIPLVALLRPRTGRRVPRGSIARAEPVTVFGLFSIPTGFAVIGLASIGLASSGVARAGWSAITLVSLGLAWASLLALLCFLLARLVARHPGLTDVNGAWLLVPASILSTSTLTSSVSLPASAPAIAMLAGRIGPTGSAIGAVTYLGLLVVAVVRVGEAGLGSHQSSWWITAGCAGLAATATADASRGSSVAVAAREVLAWSGFGFWVFGSLLLIPLVIASVHHLIVLRRPWGPSVWPPTFSTGAYALGAGQVAMVTGLGSLSALSAVAGTATLLVFACTLVGWFSRAEQLPPAAR